jgi:hypothetical protein
MKLKEIRKENPRSFISSLSDEVGQIYTVIHRVLNICAYRTTLTDAVDSPFVSEIYELKNQI